MELWTVLQAQCNNSTVSKAHSGNTKLIKLGSWCRLPHGVMCFDHLHGRGYRRTCDSEEESTTSSQHVSYHRTESLRARNTHCSNLLVVGSCTAYYLASDGNHNQNSILRVCRLLSAVAGVSLLMGSIFASSLGFGQRDPCQARPSSRVSQFRKT